MPQFLLSGNTSNWSFNAANVKRLFCFSKMANYFEKMPDTLYRCVHNVYVGHKAGMPRQQDAHGRLTPAHRLLHTIYSSSYRFRPEKNIRNRPTFKKTYLTNDANWHQLPIRHSSNHLLKVHTLCSSVSLALCIYLWNSSIIQLLKIFRKTKLTLVTERRWAKW